LFTKAFCKSRLSCAEIEVYHNVRLSQCAFVTMWSPYVTHMLEVLHFTYTGNLYFGILLPGEKYIF
jgi:hypothetical protein